MSLYLEISPLQEAEFTGVSVVAERIAAALLEALGDELSFFLGDALIPRAVVEDVLALRSGADLQRFLTGVETPRLPPPPDQFSYGLFPNVKTLSGVFSVEAQIVHDLSTLLTPEFHRPATVAAHAPSFHREVWSNDTTFCVSQATADDCALYLGAERRTRLLVMSEGADWDPRFEEMAARLDQTSPAAKPFVLVLATLEPRKNIDALLALIAARPALLETYDFVFVGRAGWGQDVRDKLARHGLENASGVHFPGFVTEFAKYALLRAARLVVYPSWFEGFGLPVLEALSLGRHVVASMSSSLTEVGGEACEYFDPNFPESFAPAFERGLAAAAAMPINEAGLAQAARFSWAKGAAVILADYQGAKARFGRALEGGDV